MSDTEPRYISNCAGSKVKQDYTELFLRTSKPRRNELFKFRGNEYSNEFPLFTSKVTCLLSAWEGIYVKDSCSLANTIAFL